MTNLLYASSTGAVLDILALLTIFILGTICAKRGFINSLIRIFGTILCLIIASKLSSWFTVLLEDWFSLVTVVSDGLEGVLVSIFGEKVMLTDLSVITGDYLTSNDLPRWLADIVVQTCEELGYPMGQTVSEIVCPVFGYYIVMAISFIILFVGLKILLYFLKKIIDQLRNFRLIGIPDTLLGLALGIIEAIIFINIAITIIGVIPIDFFQNIIFEIENSLLTGLISKINVFELIFVGLSKANFIDYIKSTLASL